MELKKCNCDENIEKRYETVEHFLFGTKIKVHNVPILYCVGCDNAVYENEKRLEMILRDAYREGNSEVNYQ